MDGYFYVEFGKNTCGIASDVTSVKIEKI